MTPMFPALNHVLYESAYQGQTCVITDTNKKIIYWGDMFPKKAKLEKVCCASRQGKAGEGVGVHVYKARREKVCVYVSIR